MDAKTLIDKLLANPAAQGAVGGLVSGGLLSALTTKGGRKMAGSALKLGGLAAVGALAYKAYSQYKQGGGAAGGKGLDIDSLARLAREKGFLPKAEDAEAEVLGTLVLRAMVSAAKADGHIDASEQARINARLAQASLSAEEQGFLLRELTAPLDLQGLVADVRTPEAAAEVYAASLLVIEQPSPEEAAYLRDLAARLGLEPALVGELEATVRAAQ